VDSMVIGRLAAIRVYIAASEYTVVVRRWRYEAVFAQTVHPDETTIFNYIQMLSKMCLYH
jgi:hypothetical protein